MRDTENANIILSSKSIEVYTKKCRYISLNQILGKIAMIKELRLYFEDKFTYFTTSAFSRLLATRTKIHL